MQDRIALDTGGSGARVGLGVARRLAAEGASLWLADVQANACEAAADALSRKSGVPVGFDATDISVREPVVAMVQAAHSRLGRVDVLVTTAWGLRPSHQGGFQGSPEDSDWDWRIGALGRCGPCTQCTRA